MKKFLKRLVELLVSAGFNATFDGVYAVVNGCKFGAESRTIGDRTIVTFLNSSFGVSPDGSFNEARAVGLLMKELPRRMEERAAQDTADKLPGACRTFYKYVTMYTSNGITLIPVDGDVYVAVKCKPADVDDAVAELRKLTS